MWQAIIWLFQIYRGMARHYDSYHQTKSRHRKGHKERIQPWVPIVRRIDIIISGTQVITCHRV